MKWRGCELIVYIGSVTEFTLPINTANKWPLKLYLLRIKDTYEEDDTREMVERANSNETKGNQISSYFSLFLFSSSSKGGKSVSQIISWVFYPSLCLFYLSLLLVMHVFGIMHVGCHSPFLWNPSHPKISQPFSWSALSLSSSLLFVHQCDPISVFDNANALHPYFCVL